MKKETQTEKGITLVALIITVIILLILATISINLVMNNGLLDKAKSAVDRYSEGEIEEQIKLAYTEWQTAKLTGTTENANDFIKNRLDSAIGNIEDVSADDNAVTVIINKNNENKTYYYNAKKGTLKQIELAKNSAEKKDSYVGCYADIDEDGTVDGVIFVDLLTGSIKDTQEWGKNGNGKYSLPTEDITVDNVKKYYISQESYTNPYLGTHEVISPKSSNGNQRFYVMQLSNFIVPEKTDGTEEENHPEYKTYSWYNLALGKMTPLITASNFGTGKENTRKMIEKWNAAGTENGYTDSTQDKQDIWKHIQSKYNEGWFIPSKEEWAAFINEISRNNTITGSNYSSYGLSWGYWSSSQIDSRSVWNACIIENRIRDSYGQVNLNYYPVRLANIF